jgi:hypothetical protein
MNLQFPLCSDRPPMKAGSSESLRNFLVALAVVIVMCGMG